MMRDLRPFESTSERDWRNKIAADLGSRASKDGLLWFPDGTIVLDPVSTRESGYEFPAFDAMLNGWEIEEALPASSDDSAVIDLRPLLPMCKSYADQCALAAGMVADRAGSHQLPARVTVAVPVDTNIVLEIGKLRALRLLVQETVRVCSDMRERSDGGDPHSVAATEVHLCSQAAYAPSSGDRQTHQIRLTYACLAAVLGGSDSIIPTPYDATSDSIRLARNVLLILRHEASLGDISDVAHGSYYLDQVSSKIYDAARRTLIQIQAEGGVSHLLSSGRLETFIASMRGASEAHE